MSELLKHAKELVQDAALDRMPSETPDNSWCAQFQEFVPLLVAEYEALRDGIEKLVDHIEETGVAPILPTPETPAELDEVWRSWLEHEIAELRTLLMDD